MTDKPMPGPWWIQRDVYWNVRAMVPGLPDECAEDTVIATTIGSEADARQIAASPDMRAALEILDHYFHTDIAELPEHLQGITDWRKYALSTLRAALAKARGESADPGGAAPTCAGCGAAASHVLTSDAPPSDGAIYTCSDCRRKHRLNRLFRDRWEKLPEEYSE